MDKPTTENNSYIMQPHDIKVEPNSTAEYIENQGNFCNAIRIDEWLLHKRMEHPNELLLDKCLVNGKFIKQECNDNVDDCLMLKEENFTLEISDQLNYEYTPRVFQNSALTDYFNLSKSKDLSTVGTKTFLNTKIDDTSIKIKNAWVVLERLTILKILKYTQEPQSDLKQIDISGEMNSIVHCCVKCESVVDSQLGNSSHCNKCQSKLDFRCDKCQKQFDDYNSIVDHIQNKCESQGSSRGSIDDYKHCGKHCGKKSNFRCELCPYETKYKKTLDAHLLTHVAGMPSLYSLFCAQCNETIENRRCIAESDCTRCGAKLLLQCRGCGWKHKSCKSMRFHIKDKCPSARELHECSKCGRKFITHKNLKRHEEEYCRKEANLHCEHCAFKTKHRQNLHKHVLRHFESNDGILRDRNVNTRVLSNLFKRHCTNCNETTKNLLKHTLNCQKCNTKYVLQCLKCDQMHPTYDSMRYHLTNSCHPEVPLRCSKCDYATTDKKALLNHIKRRHSLKVSREKCSKCCKLFKFKADLKQHTKYCGREPNLSCDKCSFRTKYPGNLQNHMRTHGIIGNSRHSWHSGDNVSKSEEMTSSKPLPKAHCPECNKPRVTGKQSVKCHVCKALLVFRCEKCDAEVSSRLAFRLHVMNQHAQDHCKCTKCGKTFARMKNLKMHEKVCGAN